ncbi:MAG: hypothetical protein K2X47_01075 [Bdellovibrionales bacterium]|nr:hypothetical protein [Bdellovibrionales bacterium]
MKDLISGVQKNLSMNKHLLMAILLVLSTLFLFVLPNWYIGVGIHDEQILFSRFEAGIEVLYRQLLEVTRQSGRLHLAQLPLILSHFGLPFFWLVRGIHLAKLLICSGIFGLLLARLLEVPRLWLPTGLLVLLTISNDINSGSYSWPWLVPTLFALFLAGVLIGSKYMSSETTFNSGTLTSVFLIGYCALNYELFYPMMFVLFVFVPFQKGRWRQNLQRFLPYALMTFFTFCIAVWVRRSADNLYPGSNIAADLNPNLVLKSWGQLALASLKVGFPVLSPLNSLRYFVGETFPRQVITSCILLSAVVPTYFVFRETARWRGEIKGGVLRTVLFCGTIFLSSIVLHGLTPSYQGAEFLSRTAPHASIVISGFALVSLFYLMVLWLLKKSRYWPYLGQRTLQFSVFIFIFPQISGVAIQNFRNAQKRFEMHLLSATIDQWAISLGQRQFSKDSKAVIWFPSLYVEQKTLVRGADEFFPISPRASKRNYWSAYIAHRIPGDNSVHSNTNFSPKSNLIFVGDYFAPPLSLESHTYLTRIASDGAVTEISNSHLRFEIGLLDFINGTTTLKSVTERGPSRIKSTESAYEVLFGYPRSQPILSAEKEGIIENPLLEKSILAEISWSIGRDPDGWLVDGATAEIRPNGKAKLRLTARTPALEFPQAYLRGFRFLIDGREVDVSRVNSDAGGGSVFVEFDFELDEKMTTLQLKCPNGYVPSANTNSGDNRKLCLLLESAKLM